MNYLCYLWVSHQMSQMFLSSSVTLLNLTSVLVINILKMLFFDKISLSLLAFYYAIQTNTVNSEISTFDQIITYFYIYLRKLV